MLESEVSTETKYKQVKTIHTVWACLKRFLNSDIKLITEKVLNSCETCIKSRKPLPRPIVAFSKAKTYVNYNWACSTCT